MAVCDFNMCFTQGSTGAGTGTGYDTYLVRWYVKIIKTQIRYNIEDKYYLVDAINILEKGLLKLFPRNRYHLPNFT
ncbi:hypothetical protein KSP40_PGU021047 [Platanthera guangdongensis]|uniref:Uncharacterized protein n=1 Tax=Platanthera guangdongensis TaxID=2320717 RepID=A0ABR2LSC8_9ASPA